MDFNYLTTTNWHREPPALPDVIAQLLAQSELDLPADYLDFLRFSNGGGGDFGIDSDWYYLWPAEEVLQLNRDYEIQQWVPGFFAIGSDGGGEALVFDTRTSAPWKLYKISFSCLAEDEILLVAESFATFIQTLGQTLN